MTAKKAAAKKPVAAKAAKAPVERDLTPVEANMAQYSAEELVKIDTLKDRGVELTGTESGEELDRLLEATDESEAGEEEAEDADLPRKVAPRFEVLEMEGKKVRLGIHFVYSANGKSALYNEFGVRISPVYGQGDVLAGSEASGSPTAALGAIARMAARNNAERRRTHRAVDLSPQA